MRRRVFNFAVTIFCLAALPAFAQESSQPPPAGRQSLEDAWWTGPMLAPSAATLPRGHFLFEPYLYVVHRGVNHENTVGSLTYLNYGLADRLTVGVIPTLGYNVAVGNSSSGIGLGDVTAQAQYRLTNFHSGSWIPTTSIAVQETFPTGKYDRLGSRPADGLGSGAFTTSLAFYSQRYFWMPNGRILRLRFNAAHAFSRTVAVRDVSVYGTEEGFRGEAQPGRSTLLNAAWEYSVTRHWVLALDATYRHDASTSITGRDGVSSRSINRQSGSVDAFGFAPAIEYNWNQRLGVLLGVRAIPASHNTEATITPAVAINIVR